MASSRRMIIYDLTTMKMENYNVFDDLATITSQPSRIMAMGVGGAGGNAIEHMWEMQIERSEERRVGKECYS